MMHKIGRKIRQLREYKNLSIEALAAHSAIHPEQLDRIEAGELYPALSTLIRIARALETRLGTLLDGEESNSPALHAQGEKTPAISLSSSSSEASKHLRFFSLAPEKTDRNMDPFLINVQYSAPGTEEPSHHEGEEFLYVLKGAVEVRYGSETYRLNEGESIYFDSIVPHCLTTLREGEAAQVLAVTYTPF